MSNYRIVFNDTSTIVHSAKGSTWNKKNHKYLKKYRSRNGKYIYVYKESNKTSNNSSSGLSDSMIKSYENSLSEFKSLPQNVKSELFKNIKNSSSIDTAKLQMDLGRHLNDYIQSHADTKNISLTNLNSGDLVRSGKEYHFVYDLNSGSFIIKPKEY